VIRSTLAATVLFGVAVGLLSFSITPTAAAPVPKHLMPKDDVVCFATRVGDRMVSTLGDQQLTCVITKVEKTDDGLRVTQEYEDGAGNKTPDQVVIASAKGIHVVEYGGKPLKPTFWWLKLPHGANNTWKEKWMNFQDWDFQTGGWEEVNVPAGKIRAIRVDRTETVAGQMGPGGVPTMTTYWFAPGMGCIKWASKDRSRVLRSFTPGK
jgi:hypothetical protein